jgi:hypothetical protein
MNIAFDVDGVVLNSIDRILEHINRALGKNLTQSDLLSWELEALGVDFTTLWDAVYYMYGRPYIEPYQGATEVLSRIHRETEKPLLFITGRSEPETALRQLRALKWNPSPPEMIVTGGDRDKRVHLAERKVGFIVEDDVEYAKQYVEAGIGFGMMRRPWNSSTTAPVTRIFDGWYDLENWFFGEDGESAE